MPKTTKIKAESAPKTPDRSKVSRSKAAITPSTDEDMPKAAKQAKKPRGEKKKKDPNAPKRGLSAYMFYANENRDRVRNENPSISFGQIGKVLGEEWKSLTDEKKSKYNKMAEADKERYERDKAKYNAGEDDDEDGSE